MIEHGNKCGPFCVFFFFFLQLVLSKGKFNLLNGEEVDEEFSHFLIVCAPNHVLCAFAIPGVVRHVPAFSACILLPILPSLPASSLFLLE